MQIVDELSRDHQRLRLQMDGLASGELDAARFERFARDLERHVRLEDEILFRALDPVLPAENGPLAAMRADHEEIEGRLARLRGRDPAEAGREIGRLVALAREHFVREEQVLFVFATRLLDAGRLVELGDAYRSRSRPEERIGISPESRVADLARAYPATIRVFQRHGLDFCCGGKRSLAEACAAEGLDCDRLASELAAELARPERDEDRWTEVPASALVEHILSRFHVPLRPELERLEAMANRARDRHGATHRELTEVASLVAKLRREMLAHLEREEREIFPALIAGNDAAVVADLLAAEEEHEEVGRLLAQLRRATDGFVPPTQACNTWRGLYFGLAELERDTHLHVHLENNILFQGAGPAAHPAGGDSPRAEVSA